jgi:periplasmic protein TonB
MKPFIFLISILVSLVGSSQSNGSTRDSLPPSQTEESVFAKVEVEASYPGGDVAWRNFLSLHLNPNVPVKKKAPAGTYQVIVQFIVGKDGSIEDIKALTNYGFGMEQEVIRVISLSSKWKPAIQNGKPVRAYRKQPISFSVTEDEKEKKRKSNRD